MAQRAKSSEAGFESRVRDALKKQGAFSVKFPGNMYVNSMPDRIIIHSGTVVFAELKVLPNDLTPGQLDKMWRMARRGAVCLRVRLIDPVAYTIELAAVLPDRSLMHICTCELEELVYSLKLSDIILKQTPEFRKRLDADGTRVRANARDDSE